MIQSLYVFFCLSLRVVDLKRSTDGVDIVIKLGAAR